MAYMGEQRESLHNVFLFVFEKTPMRMKSLRLQTSSSFTASKVMFE
jgi:hypothetical protein